MRDQSKTLLLLLIALFYRSTPSCLKVSDFSVSPSPFGLDFGTLDFGLGLDNYLKVSSFINHLSYFQPSGPPSRLTDPSYIEMSPSCPSFSLKSDDYVRMDHIYPGPSQPPQSESLPSGVLSPAQRRSSHIFGRLFKKGNRHKADYVFVDFERDNYMDMGRIQEKNWKFLTYFPKHKKLSC